MIRVEAATVIAGDCEFRSFRFPVWWFWLPLRIYAGLLRPKRVNILGQDLAGEIESVGKDVSRFDTGDQVFAATEIGLGAYAQYKCLREDRALAIRPANMTAEEAAAVPTGGLNALHYLRKGNIQSGEAVLINGAAGTIGSFAVQLAKHFGAEVTGVDSTEKVQMLRSLGADHVIDYMQEDFTAGGQTYDVILDMVATSSFSRCLRSLKPKGRYVLANPRLSSMVRALWTSMTSSKKALFEFASYKIEDLVFLKDLIEAGRAPVVPRSNLSLRANGRGAPVC